MKQYIRKPKLVVALFAAALVFTVAPAAYAHGSEDHSGEAKTVAVDVTEMQSQAQDRIQTAQERLEAAKAAATERAQTAKDNAEARLSEAKLRVCERREQAIGNIMDRIVARSKRHIEVIDLVSQRVQTFYTDKGLTVENYTTLLADVATAKANAEAAVAATEGTQVDFACNGDDPKSAAASFKETADATSDAVKAYRDAVKTLLTAVKSAAQTADAATTDNGEEI